MADVEAIMQGAAQTRDLEGVGKPYFWRKIVGTERFRAVCREHGDMGWRLVNHKDYPDTVIGRVRGLAVDVKGQLMQIWRCTTGGCGVETVC